MREVLFAIAFMLVSAVPTLAQVHPCDEPPQQTPTKGTRLGWCHDRKDVENLLYPQGALGFKIYLPGTVIDTGTNLQPIGPPSPTGDWYFEFPVTSTGGRGEFSVSVTAYSAEGESLPSVSIVWQIGGPPSIPKKPRVK